MSGNMHPHKNVYSWQSDWKLDNSSTADTTSVHSEDLGNERAQPADIRQRVNDLYKNNLYTDVKFTINCGIKPRPVLYAHKAILAVGSQKFADLLFGSDVRDPGKTEIQLSNQPYEAFKSVVEYLYTDDVYFDNDSQVMETLTVASTFKVQNLVKRCESYFESTEITENNACNKLHLATTHKMESLRNRASQFIQENTLAVIRSYDFKSTTPSTVKAVCRLPKLNLRSEQELFDAILTWIESQPATRSTRRETFEPFLRSIRFLAMPCSDFSQLVQRCPDIFTAEEALNIVMYLSNPSNSSSKLPSWCNKGGNRCFSSRLPMQAEYPASQLEQKLSVSLKPVRKSQLSHLTCILQLKCSQGSHQIKALRLAFGDPVTDLSCLGHLAISCSVEPSRFRFTEHLRVENSKDVLVPFTNRLLVGKGDTLVIRAEAREVKNYCFLQFDENNSFSETSSFDISLGSIPKENKLFFIKEVVYVVLPSRRRPPPTRLIRGGRR